MASRQVGAGPCGSRSARLGSYWQYSSSVSRSMRRRSRSASPGASSAKFTHSRHCHVSVSLQAVAARSERAQRG